MLKRVFGLVNESRSIGNSVGVGWHENNGAINLADLLVHWTLLRCGQ